VQLLAALAVMLSHSYQFAGLERLEPIRAASAGELDLGNCGTAVLFTLRYQVPPLLLPEYPLIYLPLTSRRVLYATAALITLIRPLLEHPLTYLSTLDELLISALAAGC
jgi:hypothetical protein